MLPTDNPLIIVPVSSAKPLAIMVPELLYTTKYMLAPGPAPASQVSAKQGAQVGSATLCARYSIDPCPSPTVIVPVDAAADDIINGAPATSDTVKMAARVRTAIFRLFRVRPSVVIFSFIVSSRILRIFNAEVG